LIGSDAESGGWFGGNSIALDNQTVIVGASADDYAGENTGAAYLFRPSAVPEPTTLSLAALGAIGMIAASCRKG
jgi:hypothetical protein